MRLERSESPVLAQLYVGMAKRTLTLKDTVGRVRKLEWKVGWRGRPRPRTSRNAALSLHARQPLSNIGGEPLVFQRLQIDLHIRQCPFHSRSSQCPGGRQI